MANREVSVAVCGAIVGIILGTGSLSVGEDIVGSTQRAIETRRATQEIVNTRARAIYQRFLRGELNLSPVDIISAPTVKDDVTDVPAAPIDKPLTVCSAVRAVLDKVAGAHDRYLPKNVGNTDLRQKLARFLEEVRADPTYCDGSEDGEDDMAAESASSSVSTVDNKCDQYLAGSVRFTLCRLYERTGKVYP